MYKYGRTFSVLTGLAYGYGYYTIPDSPDGWFSQVLVFTGLSAIGVVASVLLRTPVTLCKSENSC
jgi:hypothetical protein